MMVIIMGKLTLEGFQHSPFSAAKWADERSPLLAAKWVFLFQTLGQWISRLGTCPTYDGKKRGVCSSNLILLVRCIKKMRGYVFKIMIVVCW